MPDTGTAENNLPSRDLEVTVSPDQMEAYLQVIPSTPEREISLEEAMEALKAARVVFGIDEEAVRKAVTVLKGQPVLVARGKPVVHGQDGQIVYHFSWEDHGHPKLREDGSVDYYDLNLVKNIRKDEVIATITLPTPGEPGINVHGQVLKPRQGKAAVFRRGKNVIMEENGQKAVAACNGHVILRSDGTVSVSPVFEVRGDVDFSTGNIDFLESVVVFGNVKSGFVVRAGGNVEVMHNVEGGSILAEGSVVVRGGIMGQGKGRVVAKESVQARFIENGEVYAGTSIIVSDAILNSEVNAGKSIVVEGKRGAIVGGVARAGEEITARTLGSHLTPPTHVEVGIKPGVRQAYKEINQELGVKEKSLEKTRQIINVLLHVEKTRGKLPNDKKETLDRLRAIEAQLLSEIEERKKRKQELEIELNTLRKSKIKVQGTIYPGVTVVIGQVTLHVNDPIQRSYLVEEDGDIRIYPLR